MLARRVTQRENNGRKCFRSGRFCFNTVFLTFPSQFFAWNHLLQRSYFHPYLTQLILSHFPDKHLAQQVFLANLQPPKSYDLKFFRSWWERPGLGNHPLESRDAESWNPEYTEDLLAIKRKESTDPFSRWVIYSFIPFFHHKLYKRWKKPLPKYASGLSSEPIPLRQDIEKSISERLPTSLLSRQESKKASSRISVASLERHNSKKTGSSTPARQDSQDSQKTVVNPSISQQSPELNLAPIPIRQDPETTIDSTPSDDTDLEACKSAEMYRYEDSKIARVVHIITIVVASMLPITSILILYFVTNTQDRMAISVAFTGLFSCSLATTTRASRMEIFAATSAFAAVQVVFMTGSNGYVN